MNASISTRLDTIGQISLMIPDVARAEGFYGENLGLRHVFTFGDVAFFAAGGTRLHLHRKDEADWQPRRDPRKPFRLPKTAGDVRDRESLVTEAMDTNHAAHH